MSSSEMVVFNEFAMPLISQMLPQRIAAFNELSGGIFLSAAGFTGDFFEQSFYDALYDNRRRVDIYAPNDAVAAVDLTQSQTNEVKLHGGFGPIRMEPKQFQLLQKPTQEGITVIASQFVDALIADQLNTTIATLVASIGNQALAVFDESTAGGGGTPLALNQRGLNRSHALFSDRAASLTTQIMRGGMTGHHAFIDGALENGAQLFSSETVQIIDILGKRSIVTDAPSLIADAGATAKVLTLVNGAARVGSSDLPRTVIEEKTGKIRLETIWQTEYDFTIGQKGYSWDEANGGSSPSDAALETGTNWDIVANDIKHTAGVLYIADAV